MSDNLSNLAGKKGLENNLFQDLLKEAKEHGTPDDERLKELAEQYLVGDANAYGTTSFYDFLKKENQGKKVYMCSGSACLTAGTQDELKKGLLENFEEEEIGKICCLGRCHENAAINYNGTNYSGINASDLSDIIHEDKRELGADTYNIGSNVSNPILTAEFPGINEYYKIFRSVISNTPEQALQTIDDSGIRGRGGAGFPMGFKLGAAKKETDEQKFIVCNADEGDPGAYSDRYLMEKQPHSVLMGMMIAGFIIGANRGVLYIRAEYPESVAVIKNAIEELERRGLNGENIDGTGFDFRFKIVEGAGAYICGEETSLLSSIEGQRAVVRVRPPYPAQKGLFNKPTVVNNVETLACVPYIIKNGGAAYKKFGTEKSSGTKLVSLDSFFNKPGIYEIEMGTPFKDVVYEFGGGFRKPVKAVHVGGPLGGIIPTDKIVELSLDFESFASAGFLMGHAGVVSVPEDFPMIEYLEHLFEFTADESCGKCFPCSIGAVRGQEMIAKARTEDYKIDQKLMDDLLETMEIGSLCALGGGLPLGIKNAMQYFGEELKTYFTNN
ncbi:MAG: NAD(P)H-dependent oxidoreductase subunit E [Flavobacteriales bacterium]|nr:NAD(P)H-dependent oxidoreductase subunit E [Flavobacteriales bacterium]